MGALVGTLITTDADENDTFSYSLGGADADKFEVVEKAFLLLNSPINKIIIMPIEKINSGETINKPAQSAAGVIQTDGSVTVGGDLVSDADEAKNIFAAVTTAGNKITIGGGGQVDIVGDLSLKTDSKQIKFGANDEITLSHSHDSGLILKHDASGDDKYPTLTLQTGDTDMADGNVMGHIKFQAPDEGTGTDAILVAAAIQAKSEGDFSSSSNATSLDFMTGSSAAASTNMTLSSAGKLEVGGELAIKAASGVLETNANFVDQVIFGPAVDGRAWNGKWQVASLYSSLMLATIEDTGSNTEVNIWDLNKLCKRLLKRIRMPASLNSSRFKPNRFSRS